MANTVTYQYALGQEVFVIGNTLGIQAAVVKAVHIDVMYGNTAINYDLALKCSNLGSQTSVEGDVYPDSMTAFAAYQARFIDCCNCS